MTGQRILAALTALMISATVSLAHDPNANPGKAQHGGQYVEHETHFGIELLTSDDKLTFYMTEHLEPKDMAGSAFKVFVQSEGDTKVLEAVADGTTLVVPLSSPPAKGSKIVLTGEDVDGQTIQARFVSE